MPGPASMNHVCIHGHFYQPPRVSPWLEEIEREESASPYHDWNERINFECYRPNTAARLVDDADRILALHNNYESLSFNFGPTLLQWLERHDPCAYRAILKADKVSCARLNGHGNAMAQVYNHIIMPLANHRDRISQVVWGIRDFQHRFGRNPEGMWLSETAVDGETLGIMAEHGVLFTVLSPFQAARWRFLHGDGTWKDARHGVIPTGRAYRYGCPNGKSIHIFFYDALISKGIAFERLLEHSSRLLERIDAAHGSPERLEGEPWLVHAATDGESYGHHFKFGDMALAATFKELMKDSRTAVANYSSFLASFPVVAEVEIIESTSWSCAHGVGRWKRDCGCHIGGEPGWNQQWREPLRDALNYLRDLASVFYERQMGKLCGDPWRARDEYIDILLDRDRQRDDFLLRHMKKDFGPSGVQRFFQLLEMQRCAMFMFTSCGWFFDDISGLESRIVLNWAARVIQIAARMGNTTLERPFLNSLAKARSNMPSHGNGEEIYLGTVRPEVVEMERVAASYAIQTLAHPTRQKAEIYSYALSPQHEEYLGSSPVPCLCGRVTVKDSRTEEEESFLYAVLHFEALDFRCSVRASRKPSEWEAILKVMQGAVEKQSTTRMMRAIDELFGPAFFSLQDVFRDLRSHVALTVSRESLVMYTAIQRSLYESHGSLIASLQQFGIAIPGDLRGAVRRLLSEDAIQLVEKLLVHEEEIKDRGMGWNETDFFFRAHVARLKSVCHKAQTLSVTLNLSRATTLMGRVMIDTLAKMKRDFSPGDAGKLHRLVRICEVLGAGPELWELQTLFHDLTVSALTEPARILEFPHYEDFWVELDTFLHCRFSRIIGAALKSRSLSIEVPSLEVMKIEVQKGRMQKRTGSDSGGSVPRLRK